ncbi:MAG: DUF5107 domain-containing protein [Lachnospiraceae bacterium]
MNETKVWEEKVIIPTYEVGEPDKNPMFLEKRAYQGSSGKIYPYPTTQKISREKTNHAWKAVYLENQYIRVMILPELGGRIQRAYDKTNHYDFVYYNEVIKPALVGLCGPWISGGIEFNWPQHHRPTTFSPVDYELRDNGDGSKSVLVHDVDQMYGTKEITTFTVYPDKAFIEVRGQLYNRTPFPQTFLWWANPAVPVNDNTQSVFPPDVHNVYDHGKRAVSRFPIATGVYYKHDYSEGVDISRYKNIPVPTSYMAAKSDYDFVGGYDYGKKAGLLHVADHHVSPGKKQWTWGCGDFGKAWDRQLTDSDGPYIELMTGMYCDNQPDFSWLKPYEEKVFKQYFMPYKEVGYVKNATIHAVLNMEQKTDGLYVCVYATQKYDPAVIRVLENGKEIFREKTVLSPVDIYEKTIPLTIQDICQIRVIAEYEGQELVSYQPKKQGIPEPIEPVSAAKKPEDIQTNEELLITAQRIEQYRHATWLPDPYYLEGLKRDPEDARINNAYGLLLLRRGCFSEAEKHFRTAIKRLTMYVPNPYDSEPFYNLGLSLLYQGNRKEAYDAFYKATWTSEEQEMSFYYLAAISAENGRYAEALEFADKGLVRNTHNVKARGLKAAILAKLGKKEEALSWIAENGKVDPFDYVSMFVRAALTGESEKPITDLMRNNPETFLMVARDFSEAGFYEEAVHVLSLADASKPMIRYYRGYCLEKLGRTQEALSEYQEAEKDPSYLCFPNKLKDIIVLKAAMKANPGGAKACYYLGCLYYDKLQFDTAINLWETSEKLDAGFPTVHRNLAIAYFNKRGDRKAARKEMEKAFSLDPNDARVFLELDQLYQRLQVDVNERLANYAAHIELIEERDDLYYEYVTALNLAGRNREAYEAIMRHSFRTWEGAEGRISAQYKIALREMAKDALKAGDVKKTEELIRKALLYPENLGEGRLEGTKDNDLYYTLGESLERQGRMDEARKAYQLATLGAAEPAGMLYYYDQPADMILYQGLAREKLGEKKEANARFYKLIDYGEQHIFDRFVMDYFAVSMPDMTMFDADMDEKNRAHCRYLMGLGKLGLGKKEEAAEDFKKVISLDRNHQNAKDYLRMIQEEIPID